MEEKPIKYIYRPYITLKDGRKLFAYERGLKAFRIPVTE